MPNGRIEAVYYELGMRAEGMEAGKAKAAGILKDLEVLAAKSGKSIDEVAEALNRTGTGARGAHAAAAALGDVGEKSEHARLGLHAFLRPLESLASESLSANAQVGNLASKLATLGLGTGLTLGILAAIALIAKGWELLTEGARKARKEIDDLVKSIEAARNARIDATVIGAQGKLDLLEVIEQQKRDALAAAQAGTTTTVRAGIHVQVVDPGAIKKAQEELTTAIQNTAEARLNLDDVQGSADEREASRLGRLLLARKANAAEIDRAALLIRRYQTEFDSITGTDEVSEARKSHLLGMIDDLTAASKKEGETSKTLLEQQAAVRAAFAAAIAAQTPDKSDDFNTSIDRLVAAAQKANLGAVEIARMVQQLRTAHTTSLNTEGADLSKQMATELAKSAGLQATALREALTQFNDEIEKAVTRGVPVDLTLVAKLRAAKEEAIQLADAGDRLRGILVQIDHDTQEGHGFIQSMRKLQEEQASAEADFAVAKSRGDLPAMEAAQQRINTLLAAEKRLQDAIAGILKEQTDETASLTQKIAGGVAALANVAFGLSAAFSGANSELTKMLGSIGQAAGGVDALMKLASTKNANGVAPGIGGLLSSGSGLLSAAPAIGQIIGGAIGLASSFFGKSPEEARRQALQKENSDALRKLTQRIGDLGLINVKGTQLTLLDQFFNQPQLSTALQKAKDGSDIVNRIIGTALDAVGLSAKDFKDLMRSFGLAIDDASKISIADVEALKAAIKDSELTQFADTFEGQMSQFDAAVKIFDLSKPIDQFNALRKAIGGIKDGGGKLQQLLDSFDLTSSEGVTNAIAALQDLFNQLQAGTISPADLGGLTPQQFEQLIEQAIGIVRAQGAGGAAGTGGFNVDRTITEVTGSRLGALLSTANTFAEETAQNTAGILSLMTSSMSPLISAPTLPSFTSGGGPAVVIQNLTVPVYGLSDPSAAREIGTKVGGAVIDTIDQQLASRAKWNRRARGLTA